MNYFMGIDIGTYESKGVLINQAGQTVAQASRKHEMEIPQPGFAEHNAEMAWWGDFCCVSKALIRQAGVDPAAIRGVGCSAIGPCCLPVDADGRPLRKAILYGIDVRAHKQIDDLNTRLGQDYVLQKYGNPITSQSVGPKILWIRENEPEIYARAAKFITSTTYLVAKLTGRYVIDKYTAAYFTPMFDLTGCDWDEDSLAAFCRRDQLADCLWTDEIAGTVTAEAAAQTGLSVGTPVTTGTADAAADAVGVGVFHPGDLMTMFGSSLYMIHVVPGLVTDRRYWAGPYLFQDTYMVASGMSTAGTLTKWFRDQLARDVLLQEQAGQGNAYDLLAGSIDKIPAGSDGLIVLPYFSGERTPINDPKAKGLFFGLTLNHTREHLYRACFEAIAYGIAQHLAGYREIGMTTDRIIAVGGGTRSLNWMQIVADVTGQTLLLGDVFGAAFGDALLAAYAQGAFTDLAEMEKIVSFRGKIRPDLTNAAVYRQNLDVYIRLYEQTKDIMHR